MSLNVNTTDTLVTLLGKIMFNAAPGGFLPMLREMSLDFEEAYLRANPAFDNADRLNEIGAIGVAEVLMAPAGFVTDADFVNGILANAGLAGHAEARAALESLLASGETKGTVAVIAAKFMNEYRGTDATLLAAANDFRASAEQAYFWSLGDGRGVTDMGDLQSAADLEDAFNFSLVADTAAGADVMRLTGDMAVRIDLTGNSNQIKELDLDNDGVLEQNGKENNNPTTLDDAVDFEIVDAYKRDLLNENNTAQNYLGNIKYDGTGFAGDGVNTDGNIFLGGLGADTALGGIGNDFLAGGGVAQTNPGWDRLDGGRNADFFFAELSLLDNTDGNGLVVNGGTTSDDAAVGNNTPQDSDWLLIEASDDEDGTVIDLSNQDGLGATFIGEENVVTGAGRTMTTTDIEHIDASGNLYGFLDDVNVAIGGAGKVVNGENVAIGASAQLHIIGSVANNILIGGYDNDLIEGGAGNDLLMGGNLNYAFNNVNAAGIVNNGMDELIGGAGSDNIVFEADGGIVEGGSDQNIDDDAVDTLWLTRESFGTSTAAIMTQGGQGLRFDLGAGKEGGIDNYAGYGGADFDAKVLGDWDNDGGTDPTLGGYTADQTKYVNSDSRVQVQDMENVIATGLGAVDYLASGSNDPELTFNNQQNHFAITSDLDLRGTAGDNTLYAAAGNDTLEGREGNDLLSGGDGVDRFVFSLGGEDADGHDVIWRQSDVNGDNLWDVDANGDGDGAMARIAVGDQSGLMEADFGQGSNTTFSPSRLTVDFSASDLAAVNKYLISFTVNIGAQVFAIATPADLATLKAATNAAEVASLVNTVFNAIDSRVTATASGNVVTITDAATATENGRTMTSNVSGTVEGLGQSFTNPVTAFVAAGAETIEDQLIFAAYNDRADGELVDDDAVFGGDTLGGNNYAQDLVVGFNVDGSTVIAERQAFQINLENLAVEDEVTVTVNGVQYSLRVGRDVDNTLIANETTQAFALRLSNYINDFLDDDTAAGKVASTTDNTGDDIDLDNDDVLDIGESLSGQDNDANTGSFILTQAQYSNEETVFMNVSVDVDDNSSNGEGATAVVVNLSDTDITLYEYDGRDAGLNAENVLFVGDSGVGPNGTTYSDNSRAILATAATAGGALVGSDAIVVNVTPDDDVVSSALEGVGGVAIYFNDAENPTTGNTDNYAIHGDDQLFGGNGIDTITAGTGDDRVYGSLRADRIDGGKDLYLVDGVIRVLNDREAIQVDAIPATLKIELIEDGAFDDTLIYQQSDFGAVGAGGATFNIALDLTANQENGGAGRVITNGLAANTTLFTNMENIRTVSGNGTLAGQGNDTLDLSISVNPITGVVTTNSANMRYFLTKEADQGGEVRMFTTVNGFAQGAGNLFTHVDGVENVIGGTGTDYLYIDQTESGKNNSFTAGTSTAGVDANPAAAAAETLANGDMIVYQNNDTELTANQLPKVVLAIGANDVDTVTMTAGQLPAADAPVDTLTGVEFINIDAVARNVMEADELNVSALTSGATVNFATNEIDNGANLVSTVIGSTQFELVTGSIADDTVILADDMDNASADDPDLTENQVGNILFDSFLTYDVLDEDIGAALDADTVLDRMTVADLRSVTGASQAAAQTAIDDAINQYEYTFNLGAGTSDRVDYSEETGAIAAVIQIGELSTNILVDQEGTFDDLREAGDRIDVLNGVEEIVAAQGDSILDFTDAGTDVQITFQYGLANTAVPVEGDEFESIVRIADGSGNVIPGLSAYVERYVFDGADGFQAGEQDVTWNRVEGSDANESVRYEGSENLVTQYGLDHRYSDDELNLRGGDNGVSYTAIETSITVDITVAEDTGTGDGMIQADITFQDGNSGMLNGNQHTVTSYGADNSITEGTLKIEASQDAEDTVSFNTASDKIYLLGVSAGVLNVDIGNLNSMVLTGFEILIDADSDDVFDMADLETVQVGMNLVDHPTDDRDTIKVGDDAVDYDGGFNELDTNDGGPNTGTISLETLNDVFHFDFDVLDITDVTENDLIIIGDDDDQNNDGNDNFGEAGYVWGPDGIIFALGSDVVRDTVDDLVVGDLDLIDQIGDGLGSDFDTIWLTNASVAVTSGGDEFVIDLDLQELQSNAAAIDIKTTTNLNASLVTTTGVTIEVVGGAATELTGSNQVDTITGGTGNDLIQGNGGDDVLAGGGVEVLNTFTIELSATPVTGAFGGGAVTVDGVTWYTTVAGDGANTIGQELADFFLANPAATIAGVVPESVSFAAGVLTVSFAEDVLLANVDAALASGDADFGFLNGLEGDEYALPGAGDDVIYAGAGADDVSGGAGNDTFVVVGEVDNSDTLVPLHTPDYLAGDTAGEAAALFADSVAAIEGADGQAASDVSTDTFAGGDGADELEVWGDVDFTEATIGADVEIVDVHSTVTFTQAQLAAMLVLNLEAGARVIVIDDVTGEELDEGDSLLALATVTLINVGGDILIGSDAVEGEDEVELGEVLGNVDATTVEMTGAQLLNEGTVAALLGTGVNQITVTSDVTMTQEVLTALAAAGIALVAGDDVVITPPAAFTVAEAEAANLAVDTFDLLDMAANLADVNPIIDDAIDLTATDAATVTEAVSIEGQNNSGVKTYAIEDTAANLAGAAAGVLDASTGVTVSDAAVLAADLNTADAATTNVLGATAVTSVDGLAADVLTAYNSAGITGLGGEAVTLTDVSVSVADANLVNAETTGVVTATITDGTAAALAALTGTGNAYTTTVSAGSAAATDLNLIDAATTLAVDAALVTEVTGLAANVLTAYNSAGITGLGGETVSLTGAVAVADANLVDAETTGVVTATIAAGTAAALAALTGTGHVYTTTVSAGSAAATDLTAIDAVTTLAVGAAAVTTVTGTVAQLVTFAAEDAGATVTMAANYAVTASDATVTDADLTTIDAQNGSGVISTSNGAGWTITALSGAVVATGSVDTMTFAAADTGISITSLAVGDKLDVAADSNANLDAAASGNAAAVQANGDWFFDTTTDVLTYWDAAGGAQEVTLTGVATLTTTGISEVFTIATLG